MHHGVVNQELQYVKNIIINKKVMNWINSWREGNKKNIVDFTLRFGVLTLFELKWNPGIKFRLLILNFGVEI